MRDLLKFEFFFAEKDLYCGELRHEIAYQAADWERRLSEGPEEIRSLLSGFRPFTSHRVLRPLVDSYRIAGDQLEREPVDAALDESRLVARCMGLGKQYQLQRRIQSADSVSQVLFRTALRLADNRDLLRPDWHERERGVSRAKRKTRNHCSCRRRL